MISLIPTAGSGGGYGINGMLALTGVYSTTTASIDDEATVVARNLRVHAADDVVIWSIGGAVNHSEAAGVGVSVAINGVATNTRAFIGDNDGDGSIGSFAGLITARGVDVYARTDGVNGL